MAESMDDNFTVTAILVTHDGATWLPEVIAALTTQSRPVDRIFAVDTGSHDSSIKLLHASGIPFVEEARDMGYGDAIEHALALTPTVDESNEWLWLIHDDSAPARESLATLLAAIAERPQIAIAGPKVRGWHDRDHLLEVGISIAPTGGRYTGLERQEQDQGQHDEIRSVLAVSTAGMLVRRDVFEKLGGLDINLALFRDDVDFGWRAAVAGYGAICVPEAVIYHAEAAANERRAVDVSEAFLHRPLLLDRRNAAYVLLVNSSWWMLPWISAQLLITSSARAILNLLMKLPGYAGDEIAAVGLLLIHPAELIVARRQRKKLRLLAPRTVAPFIPSMWSQIRSAFDHLRETISERLHPQAEEAPVEAQTLGTPEGEIEEGDFTTPLVAPSILKNLIRKPQVVIAILIGIISLIAARNRFGFLSGGALVAAPASGMTLLRHYAASWHLIGEGSAAQMPPWIAFIGVSSIITAFNMKLLLSLIFIGAPGVTYLAVYRVLLRQGVQRNFGLIGAGIYVASPLLWGAINQGRIGTLLVLQLAPTLLSLNPLSRSITAAGTTWRKIFALSLLASVLFAFSPLLLAGWLFIQGFHFITELIENSSILRTGGLFSFMESDGSASLKRRLTLWVTPFFLLFPWSGSLLRHPTQFLLEPGIPTPSGNRWEIFFFNPGGQTTPPLWIASPFILFLIAALWIKQLRSYAVMASVAIGISLGLSQLRVVGHGSEGKVWTGPIIAIAMIVLLAPLLRYFQESLPHLRERGLGAGHIGSALLALVTALSLIATPIWVITSGANSLVRGGEFRVTPAFVSALTQTEEKPKTIILKSTQDSTSYFITRGEELQLGDPDAAIAMPVQILHAMDELIAGTGLTSSKVLGKYGIAYLVLRSPVSLNVARTIDGIGGFIRMSSTADGIVWKVIGASPRVLFTSRTGGIQTIPSLDISASGDVDRPGVITLAEKFDKNWHLLLDGTPIPVLENSDGLPTFTLPTGGHIELSHDGTKHRALISLQLLVLLVSVVMALPAGRRRKEVPIEELV